MEEKLKQANQNIEELVDSVLSYEQLTKEGYCPYICDSSEREKICNQYEGCSACKNVYYREKRKMLLKKYIVN